MTTFRAHPVLMIQNAGPREGVPPFPLYVHADGAIAHQGHIRGKPERLLGFAERTDTHHVSLDLADFLTAPTRALGSFAMFGNADGSTTVASTPLATSIPMTVTGEHRHGIAVYDETAKVITVTPETGEPICLEHTRLPVSVANTLAEHGWSLVCPGATIPYFTPTGAAGQSTARVISYSLPRQWLSQCRAWSEMYGHLGVTVQGVGLPPDSRVRFLLIRPGDVLEGDTQILEVPDPNGMLFEKARRAPATNQVHADNRAPARTFGDLIGDLLRS